MRQQRGSTLIIVLFILVVMTVVGTWAIRQSVMSLNITTNSQAQQLLMQATDTVFYRLGLGGYAANSSSPLSLIGYSMQNEGNEVVFCFRSQTSASLFNVSNTSLLKWNESMTDTSVDGQSGFCSLSTQADYASLRMAQMTQISIIVSPPTSGLNDVPLSNINLGTDLESFGQPSDSKKITVFATSILPALSPLSVTDRQITACLQRPQSKPLSGTAQTMSECLKSLGVPFNTQIQSYIFDSYQRAG